MLLAKIPVHVVAARLGHADANTTLTVYAHVLKDAHHEAAEFWRGRYMRPYNLCLSSAEALSPPITRAYSDAPIHKIVWLIKHDEL